jgi:hypothetical protein
MAWGTPAIHAKSIVIWMPLAGGSEDVQDLQAVWSTLPSTNPTIPFLEPIHCCFSESEIFFRLTGVKTALGSLALFCDKRPYYPPELRGPGHG